MRARATVAELRASLFAAFGLLATMLVSHPAAAQGSVNEIAYVESVNGRALAMVKGKPMLLDSLDVVDEKTRIDLLASSELRLCHYRAQKIFTLTGPLRALITDAGVSSEAGAALAPTTQSCAKPTMSSFQGGIIARTTGLTPTKVSLQPAIKIVDRSEAGIRNIALWDSNQQRIIASFDRNTARLDLEEGRSYLLVVGRNDGNDMKMLLQATRSNDTRPLILVVR